MQTTEKHLIIICHKFKFQLLKKKRITASDDDDNEDDDVKHDIKKKKMNQINEYHGIQDHIK